MASTKLQDAHVLILGGSSGIGFGVAEAALAQGCRVTISSSNQAKIDAAVAKLQKAFPAKPATDIAGHACDLSKPEVLEANLEALFQAATTAQQHNNNNNNNNKNNKVDHVVFTAGNAVAPKPLSELSIDGILAAGHVRFLSPFIIGKLAPKYMSPGPRASITLTGGTLSRRPVKNWAVQAGWSSGVEGITRGLAVELAPLRVNLVSPGAVRTELFDGLPDSALQMIKDWSLVDKIGTPEEVAESYIYFMRSTFASGTVLQVDGGRLVK